jgi:hypothetical protein
LVDFFDRKNLGSRFREYRTHKRNTLAPVAQLDRAADF